MNYEDVTKIEDLTSSTKANEYISLGWKLAFIYSQAYDTEGPGCNHQTIHFVMVWKGENPQYPQTDDQKYGVWL